MSRIALHSIPIVSANRSRMIIYYQNKLISVDERGVVPIELSKTIVKSGAIRHLSLCGDTLLIRTSHRVYLSYYPYLRFFLFVLPIQIVHSSTSSDHHAFLTTAGEIWMGGNIGDTSPLHESVFRSPPTVVCGRLMDLVVTKSHGLIGIYRETDEMNKYIIFPTVSLVSLIASHDNYVVFYQDNGTLSCHDVGRCSTTSCSIHPICSLAISSGQAFTLRSDNRTISIYLLPSLTQEAVIRHNHQIEYLAVNEIGIYLVEADAVTVIERDVDVTSFRKSMSDQPSRTRGLGKIQSMSMSRLCDSPRITGLPGKIGGLCESPSKLCESPVIIAEKREKYRLPIVLRTPS